ncbi:hypothetical protein [Psychrobacillus sp.]|uniref:hypothetical protein n=1 Tax=Psychrobacillus sp. TaxID=1871623 RepID=UPI0028BE4630|nr:hypothetical protein [Psychrobacillus sp.]
MIIPIITIIIWLFIGLVYSFKENKIPRLVLWGAILVVVLSEIESIVEGRG